MQVFELHFNPHPGLGKRDVIFDSFCYEPENVYEKRLRSLYMVGKVSNVLPKNARLLSAIAWTIKNEYYNSSQKSFEESFKDSLKKANEFLSELSKKGDISWLSNLDFAVLSIKKSELNLAKFGDAKIFLLRQENLIDIGKNLEFQEIEPYPLKIFSNIVTGKLSQNDKIIVLTKELSDFFSKENIFSDFFQVNNEKILNRVLKKYKKEFSKISGVCLFCLLTEKKHLPIKLEQKAPVFQRKFSKVFALFSALKKKAKLPHIPKIHIFSNLKTKLVPRKLRILISEIRLKFARLKNKNIILISLLILVLILGSFFANKEKREEIELAKETLNNIELNIIKAESFLRLKNTNQANNLLQEAWQDLLPIIKTPLKEKANILKEKIEENLFSINKLEKISEPEIFLDLKERLSFIPQKTGISNDYIYFFNSYSSNLYFCSFGKECSLVSAEKNLNLSTKFDKNSIIFFSKPNSLIFFEEDKFKDSLAINLPYKDCTFTNLSSFKSNIYFLDNKSGQIIKYHLSKEKVDYNPPPTLEMKEKLKPTFWFSKNQEKLFEAKSMTIDGSIWVLSKDNSINQYFAGNFQKTLKLNFFPYPENFLKIFTSPNLSYLYILEPSQSRIIIINKSGEIIKQYQSEKFDNLLDFTVSEDEKTIYLLNTLKVYKIKMPI